MKHRNGTGSIAQKPEELLNDLRALVTEAEKLIGETASEQSEAMMASLRERFTAAQERLSEAYDTARRKVVAGAKYTDETIRENPYQSLAVALGVGVLVGVLVGRRR